MVMLPPIPTSRDLGTRYFQSSKTILAFSSRSSSRYLETIKRFKCDAAFSATAFTYCSQGLEGCLSSISRVLDNNALILPSRSRTLEGL